MSLRDEEEGKKLTGWREVLNHVHDRGSCSPIDEGDFVHRRDCNLALSFGYCRDHTLSSEPNTRQTESTSATLPLGVDCCLAIFRRIPLMWVRLTPRTALSSVNGSGAARFLAIIAWARQNLVC